jgi:RNA polymerase sigma-70 factor (ECF subfamily)
MREPGPDAATGDRWVRWYRAGPGERETQADVLGEIRAFLVAVSRSKGASPGGAADASDVAQDCWIKLTSLEPGQEFRGTTGPEFLAWLRTIAERRVLDVERARKAQKRGGGLVGRLPGDSAGDIAVAADASTPSQPLIRQEEHDALEAALRRLPANYEQVLRLRFSAENLTFAEIAGRVGSTEDAVKQLCRRAIERLTEELRANDERR